RGEGPLGRSARRPRPDDRPPRALRGRARRRRVRRGRRRLVAVAPPGWQAPAARASASARDAVDRVRTYAGARGPPRAYDRHVPSSAPRARRTPNCWPCGARTSTIMQHLVSFRVLAAVASTLAIAGLGTLVAGLSRSDADRVALAAAITATPRTPGHTWRLVRGKHWQIESTTPAEPTAVTDAREATNGVCGPGMVE